MCKAVFSLLVFALALYVANAASYGAVLYTSPVNGTNTFLLPNWDVLWTKNQTQSFTAPQFFIEVALDMAPYSSIDIRPSVFSPSANNTIYRPAYRSINNNSGAKVQSSVTYAIDPCTSAQWIKNPFDITADVEYIEYQENINYTTLVELGGYANNINVINGYSVAGIDNIYSLWYALVIPTDPNADAIYDVELKFTMDDTSGDSDFPFDEYCVTKAGSCDINDCLYIGTIDSTLTVWDYTAYALTQGQTYYVQVGLRNSNNSKFTIKVSPSSGNPNASTTTGKTDGSHDGIKWWGYLLIGLAVGGVVAFAATFIIIRMRGKRSQYDSV